jgi:RND superfamily putative drug exporter
MHEQHLPLASPEAMEEQAGTASDAHVVHRIALCPAAALANVRPMRALARWCYRHRIIVIVAWVAVVVVANGLVSSAGTNYKDDFKLPNTESAKAISLLQHADRSVSGDKEQLVIATHNGSRITDPEVQQQARTLFAKVRQFPGVSGISTGQTAPGGTIAFANVQFSVQPNRVKDTQAKNFVHLITSATSGNVQFEVEGQIARQGSQQRGSNTLLFGFLAAGIVLFVVFGSLLAMLLPLLTAGVSLGTGIAVVGLLSNVMTMATFSDQLALLIGLGVGVDYALFIVTRYRQAMLRGVERQAAVIEAIDTSGRAVLFAGIIVCLAMLGMFVLGFSFLYGPAIAAAIAVAFTVVAALTLLPALLGLFGNRVLRRRDRRALSEGRRARTDESPAWARWTGAMDRQPFVFAGVAALLMIVIALPFLGMRLGASDAGSDPTSTTTRKAYDILARGFGPGTAGPLELVARLGSQSQETSFRAATQAVKTTPDVAAVTQPVFLPAIGGGYVGIANAYAKGSPQDASTTDLLSRIRGSVLPPVTRGSGVHVLVTGDTAITADFTKILSSKLPLFVAIVVIVSFLLLVAVFRSILIPLTAAVMNLLSVAAALGVITAVFQHGWGASLIGINRTGPIEAFVPALMFPILFGLSMDYEVFLISRIYEEWHRRGDNREAVTHGLAATGRTITAAAAIMVLVFGAFVLGGEQVIELFGVGLASAVLLDALIVRSVLVPALMMILGPRNWWLPAWLERRLPRLRIEGAGSDGGPPAALPGLAEPSAV